MKLHRELGPSSEEVSEIGKGNNSEAFGKHYSRLGAVTAASRSLTSFLAGTTFGVHNVSPGDCAEPDLSRTPGNGSDLGGRDGEGEAKTQVRPASDCRQLLGSRVVSHLFSPYCSLSVVGGFGREDIGIPPRCKRESSGHIPRGRP